MTTLTIAEARNNLADAINRVSYGGERVIFSRRGKSVAALVSFEDLELLQKMEDAEDIPTARKALREHDRDQSGAVTLDEYVRTRSAHK
jgi:prevent-host-death family protein